MDVLYRPLVQCGPCHDPDALILAGGWGWFTRLEALSRHGARKVVAAADLPDPVRARLTAPRVPVCGLEMSQPRLMGILNTTPDSFSDGGRFDTLDTALTQARALIAAGADLLDIGGESTRPGAAAVPDSEEIARTAPVIAALRTFWTGPVSIDTRKAGVARAALASGADMINDVSAFTHDPGMAGVARDAGVPVCLMHAQGPPETMQDAPRYENVVFDVYAALEARLSEAEAAGIPRARIIADPGIGFGKTLEHNLALLADLSVFHGLGCPILLGASRKRFIGTLSGVEDAGARMAGSLGVALHGIAQGVQVLRVHDMAETRQAVTLWRAATTGART